MRRLLCTRRQVPLDRADDYLLAWTEARLLAESAGGRAWIFRGVDHEDHFLEFLEWDDGNAAPLQRADLADALASLRAFAPALTSDEWEEAS
jgi:hypothetical protein